MGTLIHQTHEFVCPEELLAIDASTTEQRYVMMIRPVAFTACYVLGTLILAAFFLLDEIYFRSFFSTWHVEFGLFPILWFTYGKKIDLPESAVKLLVVFLVFFSSVYVFLSVFLPDSTDDSWPATTAHSTIFLTSMAITFVLCRRFNKRTAEG